MDKRKICFIRAKLKEDYVFDAIKKMGYKIIIPYKDCNIFMRCLREAWFRLRLPKRSIWYNKKIKDIKAEIIIFYDPLITSDLIGWVRNRFQNARILLCYENRVAKTINPDSVVDPSIEKWSYDLEDCNQYGMHFAQGAYLDIYRLESLKIPRYDILYVGRDKGRAKKLFRLQRKFEAMNLKTYFHICADRKYFNDKKSFYKPVLTYQEYLSRVSRSRAILNIMPEGQKSITMRDYEVVFNGVKGITNNKAIKEFELYHPSRFFILNEDKIEKLPEFLDMPFEEVSKELLKKYTYDSFIKYVLEKH